MIFTSTNLKSIKRIYSVIKTILGNIEIPTKKNKNTYSLKVEAKKLLDSFENRLIEINKNIFKLKTKDIDDHINSSTDELKALLRGIFIGSGTMTNPNNGYYLEIYFKDTTTVNNVCKILKEFGIDAKINIKENEYAVYIKEGEQISDFLALIGASSGVIKFEEIRVLKDIKNNVNRSVNCETANLNKTIDAAMNVIEKIEELKKINKFEMLPQNLKEIAELRTKHPEATLKEIGQMLTPSLSKSGVSHRLNKILKII